MKNDHNIDLLTYLNITLLINANHNEEKDT